ncbi:O-antigen ligase family protein [Marinomonas sp. 5E14-1]|uniref:O-antigen ligase family protein n=1 Tax=Marinomonas sp. 5E14-1 TaxID=3153922 RepID=UPI003265D493
MKFFERKIGQFVWFCAGLIFALSISFPDGYHIGAWLLFLSSISLFFLKNCWKNLDNDDKVLFYVFLIFLISICFSILIDWFHSGIFVHKMVDRFSLIIVVLPVFILLLRASGYKEVLWYGICVGSISAFLVALYERAILDLPRARGAENPIMFGDISMLLGFLSFVGAIYYYSCKKIPLTILFLIGGLSGVASSILSGSRGGWVAIPFIIIFLLWESRELLGRKRIALAFGTFFMMVSVAFFTPQTGIKHRVEAAVSNVSNYVQETNKVTSVGMRFDMWKSAIYMFLDSPIFGVGESQIRSIKQELADSEYISQSSVRFFHAHNEVLDTVSKRGLVGLAFLLALYFIPLKLFMKKIREGNNWNIKSYALAGAVVPMSYIDFGFTEVIFSHDIGVMMYFFSITIFWAAIKHEEKDSLLTVKK